MSEHNHGHEHKHDSSHSHTHGGAGQSEKETLALLNYMIDHNKHHGEDLHEIYHTLETAGNKGAAELVNEAMRLYDDGNEKLAEALKLLGG